MMPTRLHATGVDPDRPTFGMAYANDGWLRAGGSEPTVTLKFDALANDAGELRFMVLGSGDDAEKRLGISRNGYLGLYEFANVESYWVIDPIINNYESLTCRLIDHQGNQVSTLFDSPEQFLNVNDGEPLEFGIIRTAS